MKSQEYKSFYDIVGALNGWDFSQLRCLGRRGVEFYDEGKQAVHIIRRSAGYRHGRRRELVVHRLEGGIAGWNRSFPFDDRNCPE